MTAGVHLRSIVHASHCT